MKFTTNLDEFEDEEISLTAARHTRALDDVSMPTEVNPYKRRGISKSITGTKAKKERTIFCCIVYFSCNFSVNSIAI